MKNFQEDYRQKLWKIPPPGAGCHPHLLLVAHAGLRAGLAPQQIFDDIRRAIPPGRRTVPDREIEDAIQKACQFHSEIAAGLRCPPQNSIPTIDAAFLSVLVARSRGAREEDLLHRSPVPIPENPTKHASLLLKTLYDGREFLFLGERFDLQVLTTNEWRERIAGRGMESLPHIIPNPLTGRTAKTQTNKDSFRCDNAVADFRFAVVEFDNLSYADQLAFWLSMLSLLPVATLIDSGGKSIHGWIRVDGVHSLEVWNQVIKNELFRKRLIPLGVDPACSNPARLSRLPSPLRQGSGRYQRLLYLAGNRPIYNFASIFNVMK